MCKSFGIFFCTFFFCPVRNGKLIYIKKTIDYEKKFSLKGLMSILFIFIIVKVYDYDDKYKLLKCQKTENNFNNIYRKKFTIYDKYYCS